MAGEMVPFEFHGDRLVLIDDDRARFLGFGPACRAIGLNDRTEWDLLLRDDTFAANTRIEYDPQSGERVRYLKAEAFHGWLFTVASDRVPPRLRAKHAAYKSQILGHINDLATRGVAVVPGTPDATILMEMAKYLERNGGERDRLLATDLVRSQVAALTGAAMNPGAQLETVRDRILYLGYAYDRGHTQRLGGIVKPVYRRERGREPATHPQWADGGRIMVAAYPPDFLPTMDGIIHQYMRDRGVRRRPQK